MVATLSDAFQGPLGAAGTVIVWSLTATSSVTGPLDVETGVPKQLLSLHSVAVTVNEYVRGATVPTLTVAIGKLALPLPSSSTHPSNESSNVAPAGRPVASNVTYSPPVPPDEVIAHSVEPPYETGSVVYVGTVSAVAPEAASRLSSGAASIVSINAGAAIRR